MGVTEEELDIAGKAWEDAHELSEAAWRVWQPEAGFYDLDGLNAYKELDKRTEELRDVYFELFRQYDLQESIRKREERDKK